MNIPVHKECTLSSSALSQELESHPAFFYFLFDVALGAYPKETRTVCCRMILTSVSPRRLAEAFKHLGGQEERRGSH